MGLRIRIRRDPDSIVLHLNISKRKMMMSSSCNSTMASSFPNPLLFLLSHNSETLDSLHPHLPFIFLLLFLFLFAFLILYKLKPKTLITKQMPLLPRGPAPWPSWEPAWIIHKKSRHSGGYLGFRKNSTMRSHASNWAMSMSFPWFRLRLEGSFWRNMMQCLHPDLFQWSPITWADSWPQSFRQWKKMRSILTSEVHKQERHMWLLQKRTEEADNLVRFIYNQCKSSTSTDNFMDSSVVNVRNAVRQYTGNIVRKTMFSRRYFGEGRLGGGPGLEEEEHVNSLFTSLAYLHAFSPSDYLSCLRVFDLDGHQKMVKEALSIINKHHDPIVDERII